MLQILPLAAAFVGYIVFWNLSLQLNSVGFYQLSKILIAPAIIILEAVWFSKLPSRLELSAVALLCIGVTLATVSDSEASILTLHTACLCNHHACVCSLPHYFSSGCQGPDILDYYAYVGYAWKHYPCCTLHFWWKLSKTRPNIFKP